MTGIEVELEKFSTQGLRRQLIVPSGVDFSSNDFFGLSRSKNVRDALIQFLESEGSLGATGSRLVSGHSSLVQETEQYIAKFFNRPAALFFGSGYLANLGVTCSLASTDSEFFSDESNHASLIDGMRLTRAKISVFRHNNLEQLRTLLKSSPAKRKIVVTESVFSMDGDGPDLSQLYSILDEFDSYLILDEAHATGVCGMSDFGRSKQTPINMEKTILVHTCGKALGGYGAFVLTSHLMRDLIINKARSLIYSTALSPIHVVQTKAALTELNAHSNYGTKLTKNIESMNLNLKKVGVTREARHIISIPICGNGRVVRAAEVLQKKNFFVRAIRSPTVPEGTERLRVTIKSFHDSALYSEFACVVAEVLE